VTVVLTLPRAVEIRVNPTGFWYYGRSFLAARKAVRLSKHFSSVPYYLTCRAIELFLKSFLLDNGWTEKQFRVKGGLWHDLERALQEAEDAGLGERVRITQQRRGQIAVANGYYAGKGFEYYQFDRAAKGYPELPDLRLLDRFADRLLVVLEPREFLQQLIPR
jgi:hypothetical protein